MLAAVIVRGLHHHGRHTSRRFAFRGRSLVWKGILRQKKVWGICQTAVHCILGRQILVASVQRARGVLWCLSDTLGRSRS